MYSILSHKVVIHSALQAKNKNEKTGKMNNNMDKFDKGAGKFKTNIME